MTYFTPTGGLPAQTELLTGRAIVTEACTVIPRRVLRDIVTSSLPRFAGTRSWILARPIAGFSTTFSQLIVEIAPGGGAERPEREEGVEGVVFVTSGRLTLTLAGRRQRDGGGGYAYLAAATPGRSPNEGGAPTTFHWIRKAYEPLEGFAAASFVTSDQESPPCRCPAPTAPGDQSLRRPRRPRARHARQHRDLPARRLDPVRRDARHGARAVRASKARASTAQRRLGRGRGRRLPVAARVLPQACYAATRPFRYLLYKDVNRQIRLTGI